MKASTNPWTKYGLSLLFGGALVAAADTQSVVIEDQENGIQVTLDGLPLSFALDANWQESAIFNPQIPGSSRFNNTQMFVLMEADGTISDWATAEPRGIRFYSDINGAIPPPNIFQPGPNDVTTTVLEAAAGNTFNVYVPNLAGGHDVLYTLTLKSDVPETTSTLTMLGMAVSVTGGFGRRFLKKVPSASSASSGGRPDLSASP